MSKNKCEGSVYNPNGWLSSRYRQCTRNATSEKDGKHYCGTHNPDAKKARDKKALAAWNAKWDERDKKLRLELAAPDLLAALEYARNLIGPDEVLDAAIAKAKGEK